MTSPPRTLIGMLTPSSNTVLEPVTAAMLSGLPDVTAHFGRFRVVEISLREAALGQFEMEPMLAAAELLADAHVGSIAWNGTSAGWLGFDRDVALCAAIEARTGVKATSAILALNEILALTEAKTIGLVSPYIDDVQDRIIANYRANGIECVADRRLGISENFAFANSTEAEIAELCRDVARAKPDAIVIYCTNMRGAPIAAAIEAETGIPVYDTVATSIWGTLRQTGQDVTRVKGWGQLFERAL
ncbi:maleate cis-trans isomerase family protein [Acuticoccus kandeliae]|uniref:maleate cis-trans isomerase family protein n=1 Tax=Acuticoccus kandeliae TaxID=2073160 RepID=UPI000D3E309C|nr:aspartate/glutamate racemase family protein [Acuticoccus kandeliae]